MNETYSRRYVVMGEGVTASGTTIEEARARFREHLSGERRIVEPVRIPAGGDSATAFDGTRFFDSLDVLYNVRRRHAS